MELVNYISENLPVVLFLAFAALAVVGAFNVILQRNPIYSAIALIVVLVALAVLFLTLYAQFLAAVQIIVYAGAIMVLFVFTIMLLNVRAEESINDKQKYLQWLAVPLFGALLAEVFFVIRYIGNVPAVLPSPNDVDKPEQVLGTVESIAQGMFSQYVLPFEATSVLLLMAIVGALLLAKRETQEDAQRSLDAQIEQEQAD